MKALAVLVATAALAAGISGADRLVAPPVRTAVPSPSTASPPPSSAELTDVVQRYCVVCHNDQLLTGNISFQEFEVESAAAKPETAEKMIRKLRAGMMPPPGMPRPGGDTLQVLVETLEAKVDEAARAQPNLGQRRFQRLSRSEYERVIHDLLALDVNAGDWLPPDMLLGSFDNASAAQGLSTTLVSSYLRAAAEVSRLAVGNAEAISVTATYANAPEVSQHAWDHVEGTPFGTRGGMVVKHQFPADGEYVFQIRTRFGGGNETSLEDVDVSIDGEPVALLMLERNAGGVVPAIQTEPIFVRAGERSVSVAFVNLIEGAYEDRFSPSQWSGASGGGSKYGVTALTHLTEVSITGPRNPVGISATQSRERIFTCHPTGAAEQRACAQSILGRIAGAAFRRPISADDAAALMRFYDGAAAEGGFEEGVRLGLQAILAAPEFVFRFEREPDAAAPGEIYRVSDVDLATRLSFFLWASAPDPELIDVAASGRLSEPSVLEQQVDRMLADPRSAALATRFAHQWLRLQDVGEEVWPETYSYPDFSRQLADDMVRETELFFEHLVREDRSMLELLSADYTMLNERLARHYGIEGVSGDEFRLVKYPDDRRRGILGHGSVLLLTSVANRTSPVLRGKWVMEVLMGTPPPPPPPNVPAFDASPGSAEGRLLTTRERMELHRAAPVCNSCHRFIDPIGLALDNFDVTGRWRIRENMAPLDTRGVFYDGTPIERPVDLANVLLKRPVPLARNFAEHLLAYAIGRPAEYFDQPTIRAITRAAGADGYRISSFILGVVKSDPFLMKQAEASAN